MTLSLAFFRGVVVRFRKAETHKRAAAPQHAADHGDRGARGPSRSCSANGPRGCRIFANYCCSVRLFARGQICRLTSRQHLEKKCLVPISAKHPSSVAFPILEIVRTNYRLHMQCTQILLYANLLYIKINGLHRGTINSGLNSWFFFSREFVTSVCVVLIDVLLYRRRTTKWV